MVQLAHTLGYETIAEGVEKPGREEARRLGCGFAQGYHLGRPCDAETTSALLAGHDPREPLVDPLLHPHRTDA